MKTLIKAFVIILVTALIYWLGVLILSAAHLAGVFATIWMVVCIIVLLFALYRLICGNEPLF